MLPPMESTWRAISSAVRCLVPLNTMCSMKWEMPFDCGASSREPFQAKCRWKPTDVLHLLGDHGEAVRQYLTTDVANFFYHRNDECEE